MKKKILFAGLVGLFLLLSGISTSILKSPKMESAEAVGTNAYFGVNGNVGISYYSAGDNPQNNNQGFVWRLQSLAGESTYEYMVSDPSQTKKTNYLSVTSIGGATLKIEESTANGNAVGIYVPFCIYYPNLSAYTSVSYTVQFSISFQGGTADNFASLYFYEYGDYSNTYYRTQAASYFNIAKNEDNMDTVSGSLVKRMYSTTSTATTGTYTKSGSTFTYTNSTSNSGHACMRAYGVFIGARKDKSSNHQLSCSITATLGSTLTDLCVLSDSGVAYDSLSTAITSVTSGSTLTLLKDCSGNVRADVSKDLTINLNGKTLSQGIQLSLSRTLTLVGPGKIIANYTSGTIFVNNGTLYIKEGVSVESSNSATINYVGVVVDNGSVTVEGTVKASGEAILASNSAAVHINGGTVQSYNANAIRLYNTSKLYLFGNATITKGTLNDCYGIYASSYASIYFSNYVNSIHYTGSKITIYISGTIYLNSKVINNIYGDKATVYPAAEAGYEYALSNNNLVYRKSQFAIIDNLTYVSHVNSATAFTGLDGLNETYRAFENYHHNDDIVVTTSEKTLVRGVDYTFTIDGRDGVLVIPAGTVFTDITVSMSADPDMMTITLDANDGTGRTTQIQAAYNSSITLPEHPFNEEYKHILHWCIDSPSGNGYSVGSYLVTGNRTFYAYWVQSHEEKAHYFEDTYLFMKTYDTNRDNSEGTGLCLEKYEAAKAAFNAMHPNTREAFFTLERFTEAKERLIAWATINNDRISYSDYSIISNSNNYSINTNSSNTDSYILIACVSALVSLAAFYFFKKKKHQ